MRLGAAFVGEYSGPDGWAAACRERGYRAAVCPVDEHATDDEAAAYARAAASADIVFAEVGAWSNPLSTDDATRRAAVTLCQRRLNLADRIGARCCVNIAGSRGAKWDGPDPRDLAPDTYDLVVETVREVLDAVKPTRTFYALETMPWMYPDSPECYERLLRDIDRARFAVHLDPANLINSPQRFFENAALIRDCFRRLGPHIKSCHAKDIRLGDRMTVHLDEVRLGLGGLDYATFLRELDRLDPDTPLLLEHLATDDEYRQGAAHIRAVARAEGITLR